MSRYCNELRKNSKKKSKRQESLYLKKTINKRPTVQYRLFLRSGSASLCAAPVFVKPINETIMRRILIFATFLGAGFTANAQKTTVRHAYHNNAGAVLLNVGIGLSNWGVPLYGGAEAYLQDFTLGGVISHRRYYSDWRNYRYDFSATTLSGIVNYHLNRALHIPSNWDLYLGANIGYNFEGYARVPGAPEYIYRRVGGLAAGLQLGGRYYFSRNAGINLELGGGNVLSDVRFGVSFRL